MTAEHRSKILIVEDEGITAQALREALIDMGHRVVGVAVTGWEAIKKSIDLKPDLVIMDIKLRGEVDGISAAQRIQSQLDIPVIYLTAYSDEQTLKRVVHSKAYGYLVKPFDEYELQSTVDKVLRQHRGGGIAPGGS